MDLNRIATRVAEGEAAPQFVEDTLILQGPFKPYSIGDEAEVEREDLTVTSPGPEFANDEDGYHLFYLDCEFDVELRYLESRNIVAFKAFGKIENPNGDPINVYVASSESTSQIMSNFDIIE